VKKLLVVVAVMGMALMYAVSSFAGSEFKDEFFIDKKPFKSEKKQAIPFAHKKHAEDYEISCGSCHHDDKGQEIADLKMGDKVQNCVECHKEGKASKKKKEKSTDFMYGTMHDSKAAHSCVGCHKIGKKGPTKCADCHPKKKK